MALGFVVGGDKTRIPAISTHIEVVLADSHYGKGAMSSVKERNRDGSYVMAIRFNQGVWLLRGAMSALYELEPF